MNTLSTLIVPLALLAAASPADAQCRSSATASEDSYASRATAASYQETQKNIVETAVDAGSFKTLAAALQLTGLDEALQGKGPFTVLAPTDEAFAKLPKGTLEKLTKPENKEILASILTYHVISGRNDSEQVSQIAAAPTLNGQRVNVRVKKDQIMVGGAKVVSADIDCSNGVIHVIDTVLLPNSEDIIGTAVEAGSFQTLAAALKAAELVEALQGDGPFTVFAPTDDAFAKLPAGTVEDLLKPENRDKLAAVLTYHVVPGRVYAQDAVTAANASTLQGGNLKIAEVDGRLRINSANVVKANIDTTNGVIHVIDSVLLPQ